MPAAVGQLAVAFAVGIVAGLALLVRGMRGYLESTRVGDTATSRIESLAAGEVRVTGTVEPAELLLVSPLQSRRCVWYRARVTEARERQGRTSILDDERAVGFRVRDDTGAIRVFARDGRFDAPDALAASTGLFGEEPVGLAIRHGPAVEGSTDLDRNAAIARLTTVQSPATYAVPGELGTPMGRRSYHEARIEPGDVVTIVAMAQPFASIGDPDLADLAVPGSVGGDDDPEIEADLAAARASGSIAASADEAWGNASIPGFGIGRPTRTPALDPAARPEPAAGDEADRSARARFDRSPDELVLAASPDVPLLVAAGAPDAVVTRQSDRFLLGLGGAILSIASAVALAVLLEGGFR